MEPAADPAVAVEQMVRDFCDAYTSRNLEKLTECFSSEPEAVVFGIGHNERRIGLKEIGEQFERDWSDTDSATLDMTWCTSKACPSTAWVAAEAEAMVSTGGQTVKFPTRMTGIATLMPDGWRWVHLHFSVPGDSLSV